MAKRLVPEFSEKKLKELSERIRPVARFQSDPQTQKLMLFPEGALYWTEPIDSASPVCFRILRPQGKAEDIEEFAGIETYHESPEGFFRPTIREILAQIPEEFSKTSVAFELKTITRWKRVGDKTYFVAAVMLYRNAADQKK